jgi:large subunit ribosomal protein L4
MKVKVLDKKGNTVEELTLDKSVFNIEPNEAVVLQYLRVYQANQRQGTSSAKTRGEVSGGGAKPWRQKGTGRARVGSTRNPLWRHGGVTHGPKPRDWSLDLPKKIKRLAILSALSTSFSNEKVKILDKLEMKEPKTKDMARIMENLKADGKTLLVLNENDHNIIKSAGNIKNLRTAQAGNLNAYDVLSAKNVIFVKDAVLSLEKKYKGKAKKDEKNK